MLELAGLIILGIVAQWVAWRLKLPAILPLILIGLAVGPIATLFTDDGTKLLEPMWNGQEGLFPGENLFYFVSLAISIILFEGGLTLKRTEIRNVGPVITKLITLGSIVTFFGAGAAAYFIFNIPLKIAFLFAALIIVTGPTVISPILRNIPLKKDVSAVLKWEGILIDPIGALVAVLIFEFISVGEGQEYTKTALAEFGKILLFGGTFGFTFAHALTFAIKKHLIPHYLLNVAALSVVLLVFVISDAFAHESGLLAVVVMGMVLGNINLPNLKELLYFKESLSVLLISILFILLAANINMEELKLIYRWETVWLFLAVVFVIRPLAVFLSTQGSNLKMNERLFISWVGPRGIVAAGIASLFGSKLLLKGEPGAEYITPLVFMIVLGTVLFNATTARLFAKAIGVFLVKSEGILIVGASNASRLIAKYLQNNNRSVVLLDNNSNLVNASLEMGLQAMEANIYADDLTNDIELNNVGYLMALTGSDDINKYALNRFKEQFGEQGSFRLITKPELDNQSTSASDNLLSFNDDFFSINEVARKYPTIQEVPFENKQGFENLLNALLEEPDMIPLFVKSNSGMIEIIKIFSEQFDDDAAYKGYYISYLGKPLSA